LHITQENGYKRSGLTVGVTWHCYPVSGQLSVQKHRCDGPGLCCRSTKWQPQKAASKMEKDSV